jgi:hypothetical protein
LTVLSLEKNVFDVEKDVLKLVFVFQIGFEVATVYSVEEDNNVVRKGMK